MAATDQHYRSQKTLDLVFGLSCGAMLLSTLWMLAQDYNRDFKAVQRQFRDVEATVAERDMVARLPDPEAVDDARRALAAARQELAAEQAELAGDEKRFKARRESQDETYRNIKADLDAQASYLNIANDDADKEPTGSARKAALEKERERIRQFVGKLEADLAKARDDLDATDAEYKEKVRSRTEPLEKALAKRDEEMKKLTGVFDRYAKLASQKAWGLGDTLRSMPILDGFASPTRINQIWLNDLTIDYGGFRDVPRYDRCTTCHLGIDKGVYDKATLASLGDKEESKRLTGKLHVAQELLKKRQESGENLGYDPNWMGGERTAPLGLITLLLLASALVGAGTLGLLERSWRVGVNTLVAGVAITLVTAALVAFFAPVVPRVKDMKLSEGEITQFCGHPRLDLYVDSNSPHPMEKFGCTTCHAGQGSATEFVLATHTPNDAVQEHQWQKKHGWAASHNWDFPMLSKRFTESSCLKCHHQVTDLIRDGSKEEAPKLLKGFNLLKDVGCFGCHEIQGVKGGRWIGPDVRLEPSPALELLSAADQEKAKGDPANPPGTLRKVGPSLRRLAEKTNEKWTRQWILAPRDFRDDTKMPHFYGLSTNSPDVLPEDQKAFPATEIHAISHYLVRESLKGLDGKDSYRQALADGARGIGGLQAKLAKEGLADKEMKELFDISRRFADLALLSSPLNAASINARVLRQRQLQEKLGDIQRNAADLRFRNAGDLDVNAALAPAKALEAELAKVTAALEKDARPSPLSAMPGKVLGEDGGTAALPEKEGNAAEGRRLFTERGCLACHAHEGTTKTLKVEGGQTVPAVRSEANFGPELSRLHEKLTPATDKVTARQWLVQWLLNPMVHHPRTKMPVTHLTPAQASDIASFLLAGKKEWKGADPAEPSLKDLKALARVYLAKAPGVTRKELDAILPAEGAGESLKDAGFANVDAMARDSDERLLAKGKIDADALKTYIGKKAIGRLGCYACHDIGGFETAKPIGVGLNDWGKKDGDRLAFENSKAFAKHHFNHVPRRISRADVQGRIKALEENSKRTDDESAELEKLQEQVAAQKRIHELEHLEHDGKLGGAESAELKKLLPLKFFESDGKKPPMEELFYESLSHHSREGFLNLKLMEPRSYDYKRDKTWDDRLRMPQFKFARTRRLKDESDEAFKARAEVEEAEAREAVMTFVLGLVAEPVPLKYVNAPKGDRAAEVAGRQVLDKYNCASCHQIQPGAYQFKMTAEMRDVLEKKHAAIGPASAIGKKDIVFAAHSAWFSPQPSSEKPTAYGFIDAKKAAAPDAKTDEVFLTEALRFTGRDRQAREIPAGEILAFPKGSTTATPAYGGTWTSLMVDYLLKRGEQDYNDNEKARSALPPPLLREGERVQPDWLYRFLLNPGVVRPEGYMKLRMPRFNMSPEESRALVNYFSAAAKRANPAAGITAPYVSIPQREASFWARESSEFRQRLEGTKDNPAPPEAKEQLAEPKGAKGAQKDPYARAALALITNKDLCVTCHRVGEKAGPDKPKGPNLALAAERLRPEWTEQWIANPKRLFAYTPIMPQNFENDPDPKLWKWQAQFVGTPLEQSRSIRDLLMDKPRLAELLEGYTPPPPPKEEKKKP